ncbi:MAG: hypothetical protein DDT36_01502 [Firmicutes bacterium]|nr:hypothetical protein [Bacillota bacterium]
MVALLKKHAVWYCTPATFGMGSSGVPDFICCANSLFLAIETKAGGGKLTTLQSVQIERIRLAGGIALVVNETNLDALESLLLRLTKGST